MALAVLNACHVDIGTRYFVLPRRDLQQQQQRQQGGSLVCWIRILTHADVLSKQALTYQMQRFGRHQPVVAVRLTDPNAAKVKQIKDLHLLIRGAVLTQNDKRPTLVCGLPNAGKSSLIAALTHHRTMEVKKKNCYHLPKISARAGHTLGVKHHAFELDGATFSLIDTPGLRNAAERMDEAQMAHLLATGSMNIPKGCFQEFPNIADDIAQILWQGLQRHASLSGETSSSFSCRTPEELVQLHVHNSSQKNAATAKAKARKPSQYFP